MSDVKLPETTAAFQEARREAFLEGCGHQWYARHQLGSDKAREEAKRRYPITKQVPRTVEVHGDEYSYNPATDGFEYKRFDGNRRPAAKFRPDVIRALASLLDNPFDIVEE